LQDKTYCHTTPQKRKLNSASATNLCSLHDCHFAGNVGVQHKCTSNGCPVVIRHQNWSKTTQWIWKSSLYGI